jgi:hypothetical protein
MLAIKDEGTYLANAYVLRAGTIFADVAHVSMFAGVSLNGHVAARYPPAESLLLLPLTAIHWRLAFVLGPLLLVAGALLFARLLAREGLDRRWALLYLLYPPLVLSARTLMPETAAALLATGALLGLSGGRRGRLLSGFLLGLGTLFHLGGLLTLGLVAVGAAEMGRPAWTAADSPAMVPERTAARLLSAVEVLLGALPALALLALWRDVTLGSPLASGAEGGFSLANVPNHLLVYLCSLLVAWPLMLLAPIAWRGRLRLPVLWLAAGTVLAMSAWSFLDSGRSAYETVILGPRLILPAAPAFLLAYAGLLDGLRRRLGAGLRTPAAAAGVALALAACIGVSAAHAGRQAAADRVRVHLLGEVPAGGALAVNDEASIFINPAWSDNGFHVFGDPRLFFSGYSGVVFIAPPGSRTSDRAVAKAMGDAENLTACGVWRDRWEVEVWRRDCPAPGSGSQP